MGRRPNGAWFAFDLATESVIAEGRGGGHGGLGARLGHVYLHNMWGSSIHRLSLETGGSDAVLYDELPDGWYNRPEFHTVPGIRGTWGMYGMDLAWFPLPK